MAIKKVSLVHDKNLLDPKFESYKLSLDPIASYSTLINLSAGLIRECSEDQYSFHHSHLFSKTNLLVQHPIHPEKVFMLDAARNLICHVAFDSTGVNSEPQLVTVWTFPEGRPPPSEGDYNLSLVFAGEHLAVVGDGSGMLFILNTASPQWQTLFQDEICGKNRPFLVSSATSCDDNIDLLLSFVEDKANIEGLNADVTFVNVVEWMTFSKGQTTSWSLDRVRRFAFLGTLNYLQLDSGNDMLAVTDKSYKLVFDSTNQDMEVSEPEEKQLMEPSNVTLPSFYYFQSVEDLIVWVALPKDVGRRDIKVTIKPRELKVFIKGDQVIGGETWNVLDTDSMTWTMSKEKLEINVSKASEGLVWQKFFKENDGEELSDQRIIDDIILQRESILSKEQNEEPLPAFNAQELEECDALPSDEFAMYLISSKNNSATTHKVNLSGNQWLFNLNSYYPNALCLRHDVDGLVWRPKVEQKEEESELSVEHVGTFSAFGYVQASKSQRKFSSASPNLNYAVISDSSRRLFLYRQPSSIPSEFDVRNRKSGQRLQQVAKQQVITMDNNDPILGTAATDNTLVVLTSSKIVCFKM